MTGKVYDIIEVVGTSEKDMEQAIENALKQEAGSGKKLDWFEVVETRGFIDNDRVKYYQVHLKIGCCRQG